MPDASVTLEQQIAECETALCFPLPPTVREQIEHTLAALREQQARQSSLQQVQRAGGSATSAPQPAGESGSTQVTITVNGRSYGQMVGVNLGTMIYARTPYDEERRQLVWYLDTLAATFNRLPLHGLATKLEQDGKGLTLACIYVMLATTEQVTVVEGTARQLQHYRAADDADDADEAEDADEAQDDDQDESPLTIDALRESYHPNYALPDRAIVAVTPVQVGRDERPRWQLRRARLATEAVPSQQGLVVLGAPGSGKSTFLRHLAWTLARQTLEDAAGDAATLPSALHTRLPIFLPLRTLAGALAQPGTASTTLFATLQAEMERYQVTDVGNLLRQALHSGTALLLFDGLDEVPIDGEPGVRADRLTTLRAVRDFVSTSTRTPALLTCRSRAFAEALQTCLGWPVVELAPLTLGQVRHVVPAWYTELVAQGHLDADRAARLTATLIQSIEARPRLREMAETPLLLTLMAAVLYDQGELPRDRPQLYEAILTLLLGQWDKVRAGQSLADTIGVASWDSTRIRPVLDALSAAAHRAADSADGRGRLSRSAIEYALRTHLEEAGLRPDAAAGAAVRCLAYMEQRSGLLMPEADGTFVFAHLTLQEHCAGRALVTDRDPVARVLQHRADDRWREPLFLGLGVVQQTNPFLIESVLRALLDRDDADTPKPIARWYRDLILAAELGQDRDWGYLRQQRIAVGTLQRDLKCGLVALLADPAQPLPVAERVRAGFLLGDLGDPRVPVTVEAWQRAVARVQQGDTSGYFCRVPAGTYHIGSGDDDPDAQGDEQPQHTVTCAQPFWIARSPLTNAQWQAWVQAADGPPSRYVNDSDRNRPNQPVVGVSWNMVTAFCTWLSAQLGVTMRLPTEQEWEAAARGGNARRYPWGNDWHADRAATEEDQDIRGWAWSVPVGCYPAGAAPCGALDMAGNVWEWTASNWASYPGAAQPFHEKGWYVQRGGYYNGSRTYVRCGARLRFGPVVNFNLNLGGRLVLAPHTP